ncbi:TVP38/TMEM64 family protein [Clostridium sp. MB40-C1]|uniref:TVP38/TMEM64 family protein n=1 Tax=Clostridium sp. MB40-C1 TaxID=3070996 RepID=UPI0027E0C626|nr:TVP38/TMEM64 family protein [Clostridium sp. MB40-C1]WMJ80166.1 TVP38/TMEM64 family protein [Clostridium sp. MB40-C1]
MRNKKLVGLIIILLVGVLIFMNRGKLQEFKNVNSLVKYIKGYGKYALLCFIIIFSLKPILLVIPSAMLSIASGILFGPIKGFTINMIGFFISGTLAFMLSRFLGKEFVDKMLKGKALSLNQNMEKKGFKILFLLRLPPVLPYDPLSYACGLTKINYKAFIFASLLGVVPETLCYSFMGENILNPLSPKFIIPLIVIIIATLLSGIAFKKSKDMV